MADPVQRELIHKVNNLLTVIYTQVALGRASEHYQGAVDALEQIQRTAEATVPYIRAATTANEGRGSEGAGEVS